MFTKNSVFTRKKALFYVLGAAVLLLILIFLKWRADSAPRLMTTQAREKFLNSLGWEVDISSEEYRSVTIPESLEGVMAEYAKMQREQGLELESHCGERCEQYSYVLTNYPDCGGEVIITLYISRGRLIAGDVHTAALDGFMHGIYRGGR